MDKSLVGFSSPGCDLRLLSPVNDVSCIPTTGKGLMVVVVVRQVLHFRIFDVDGTMLVDTDAKRLAEQASLVEELKTSLESLWPPHELTEGEKARIIAGVTAIVGHSHSPTSAKQTDPFGELKIFAGRASQNFAQAVCGKLGTELAKAETIVFSEGNVFVRVLENVRGRDVFIVQGTDFPVNDNFMELLFWIDAFKRASATQVTAVIPFFSYAKGDKKDEPRVSIRARVCADAIEAAGADRVLTMDLHSPQIQGFFKIPVDHLYAMPVLVDYFRKKEIPDLVVASPDVGFGKQAYRFAQLMHTSVVFGNKIRQSHDECAEVLDVIGSVDGKNVLIVDDFTISGGTIVEMAIACKERGAKDIYACVSHGVFAKGAAEKLRKSPIKELVLTDTIEYRFEELPPCCRVVSVAGLFAEAILSIHRRESVSRLFNF